MAPTHVAPVAPPPPKPKPLRRLVLAVAGFLGKRILSLCWITYALGLVWVLLHPAVTVSTGEAKPRGTYISENALLIDSFDPRNSHEETLAALEYQRALAALPDLPPSGCNDDCAHVLAWLETELERLDRVESFRHSFYSERTNTTHTNVYGILRAAPLADGKESIVLVTHYRNIGADSGEHSGVALALALLAHLVDAKWLAKDVIVLFADDGPLDGTDGFAPGTEAWLDAYHIDPLLMQDHHSVDALPMRAGVIRAALNLETRTRSWDASVMGVFAAGMNGQLPNLDLVNTAVMALRGEHIPVVLDRCTGGTRADPFCHNDVLTRVHAWLQHAVDTVVPIAHRHDARAYVRNLHGMLRFMKTLATGPAGAHAPFVRYNIDSITLSARASYDSAHIGATALSLRAMLRAVEKTVRALSNLEEKLHQSFFLYVLPNTHDFVSVGEYYYVVALAVSPAIAHMGVLASRTIGMRVAFSLLALVLVQVLAVGTLAIAVHVWTRATAAPALVRAASVVLAVTAGQGVFVARVLPLLRAQTVVSGCAERRDWRVRVRTYEEKHRDDDKKKTEAASEGALPAAATPARPLRDILASIPQQDSGWRGIKFVVMILLVYAHCILGIINYPMALFCAVPMALFALIEPRGVKQSALKQLWCALWLLVSSPLVLFALGVALDRDGVLATLAYVAESFAQRTNLLALPYVCCLYVPVHTLSLGIWLFPITDATDDDAAAKKEKTD